MLPKTPLQDFPCEETEALHDDALRAYREAALSDSYMFGEYDGFQAYKGDEQSLFFYKYFYQGIKIKK